MSNWPRAVILLLTAVLGLPAAAPIRAADPTPPVRPANDFFPHVTLEIRGASIVDAAEKISEATRLRLYVSPQRETVDATYADMIARSAVPPVDYQRTASLSWKDAPLGAVLRDFARAYHCRLVSGANMGGLGDVAVLNGAMPGGPSVTAEGYELRISRLALDEHGYRFRSDTRESTRTLHVEFAVRALSGDPASLIGLGYVQATDQNGRIARQWTPDEVDPTPSFTDATWIQPTWGGFPDEMLVSLSMPWPYPAPHGLRALEGDLVLSRLVQRHHVELPMPAGPGKPAVVKDGSLTYELDWGTRGPRSFVRILKLIQPHDSPLWIHSLELPRVSVELADGRRVLARLDPWGYYYPRKGGPRVEWTYVRALDLPAPPRRLIWEPALKTWAPRRVHFRFKDFPALLDTPAGPAAAPAPGKPAPGNPSPGAKPSAPVPKRRQP